jgi:hypothetical protein
LRDDITKYPKGSPQGRAFKHTGLTICLYGKIS